MTTVADFAVQAAIYAKLTADDGVLALLAQGAASITDAPQAALAMPYVVLGDMTSRGLDAQGSPGREASLTLTAYSGVPQAQEIRLLSAALHAALDGAQLDIAGHSVIDCRVSDIATGIDADGRARKGVLRVTVTTERA